MTTIPDPDGEKPGACDDSASSANDEAVGVLVDEHRAEDRRNPDQTRIEGSSAPRSAYTTKGQEDEACPVHPDVNARDSGDADRPLDLRGCGLGVHLF